MSTLFISKATVLYLESSLYVKRQFRSAQKHFPRIAKFSMRIKYKF